MVLIFKWQNKEGDFYFENNNKINDGIRMIMRWTVKLKPFFFAQKRYLSIDTELMGVYQL